VPWVKQRFHRAFRQPCLVCTGVSRTPQAARWTARQLSPSMLLLPSHGGMAIVAQAPYVVIVANIRSRIGRQNGKTRAVELGPRSPGLRSGQERTAGRPGALPQT
jgi:hypothetical protein